ncbi:MAG: alpha/beta hydrolase [Burkholderiales bacterium]|nr:alpha/beta hydrolase [Burkholderiales bacterium]
MKPRVHQIQLPGRVRLEFAEQGARRGTPVIALHGVTDSWRSFEPVLPHLPSGLHVLALTQRGHGDSDKPSAGYRPADFAADVAAFMDAMEIERAVLVGHSMGSVNAMRCAIDHPSRVAGLLLAGTMPWFGRQSELLAFHRDQILPLADPVPEAFARDFQLSTLARPIGASMLDGFVTESLKVPAHVWRDAFAGFIGDDFSLRLRAIDVPALIVWGRQDAFCTAADQQAMLGLIRTASLVTYADAGHAMHWEEPRRFARDLRRLVDSVAAHAATA